MLEEEELETAARRSELERYAARSLEWDDVREVFARYASSSLGHRALAQLVPRKEDEMRRALLRVRELMALRRPAPGGASLAAAIASGGVIGAGPPLAGLTDPAPVMGRTRREQRPLDAAELQALERFLDAVRRLERWLSERRVELPVTSELVVGLPDVEPVRERLDAALDGRGELVDDASPRLGSLRREKRRLERSIERRVKAIAGRPDLRAALSEGHAGQVHRRGERPVLAVRAKSRGRVPGLVHDRSQTGETLFVEPQEVVEDGNHLAGLRSDERAEETRLLVELTHVVLAAEAQIAGAADRMAELELSDLSAHYALDRGGLPARLPGDAGAAEALFLKSMRHPLLDEEVRLERLNGVVPLDLRLGADYDLLVVTGPNTGGKTLALKACGLAALLTRMGLPLLAEEGTTVPVYDGVVADIGDEQELRQSLSTFSSHLVRIRDGLARAGDATLVLLDELGGGTDPAEGGALGYAILAALLERRVPTLASTHIGRLKEFAFRHARAENACVEFDVATLAPMYRLLVGTPGESQALHIATALGFDAEIVRAAREQVEQAPEEVDLLMSDLRVSREDSERVRTRLAAQSQVLEEEVAARKAEQEELDQKRELLEAEAQRDLENRLRSARPHLDRARALIEQVPAGPAREALGGCLEALAGELDAAGLGERRETFLNGLKKGEFVYLPRYKKRLQVKKVSRDRREVTVLLGRQRLVVPFDDVTMFESL